MDMVDNSSEPEESRDREDSDCVLICFWGGQVKELPRDVEYIGGQKSAVVINALMNLTKIMYEIRGVVGCDISDMDLKLQMKYPLSGGFITLPLDDDHGLAAMWYLMKHLAKQKMFPSVAIYVDQVPKDTLLKTNVGSHQCETEIASGSQSHLQSNNYGSSSVDLDVKPCPLTTTGSSYPNQGTGSADNVCCNQGDKDDGVMVGSPGTQSAPNSFTLGGEFAVGQEFDTIEQLKDSVKSYTILKRKLVRIMEASPMKYVIECARKKECGCSWRLRAVQIHPLPVFKIVRYNGPHTRNCGGEDTTLTDHPLLTSKFVSRQIKELVRADPLVRVRGVIELIRDRFDYTITYKKAWLAKQRAMGEDATLERVLETPPGFQAEDVTSANASRSAWAAWRQLKRPGAVAGLDIAKDSHDRSMDHVVEDREAEKLEAGKKRGRPRLRVA